MSLTVSRWLISFLKWLQPMVTAHENDNKAKSSTSSRTLTSLSLAKKVKNHHTSGWGKYKPERDASMGGTSTSLYLHPPLKPDSVTSPRR